jgi:hypothetical protein
MSFAARMLGSELRVISTEPSCKSVSPLTDVYAKATTMIARAENIAMSDVLIDGCFSLLSFMKILSPSQREWEDPTSQATTRET